MLGTKQTRADDNAFLQTRVLPTLVILQRSYMALVVLNTLFIYYLF